MPSTLSSARGTTSARPTAWQVANTPQVPISRIGRVLANQLDITPRGRTQGGVEDAVAAIPDILRNMLLNPESREAMTRGLLAGAVEGAGNYAEELTSPLSALGMALSGGSAAAGRQGLGTLSRRLGAADAVLNLPAVLHGGYTAGTAGSVPEAAAGLTEAALGGIGLRAAYPGLTTALPDLRGELGAVGRVKDAVLGTRPNLDPKKDPFRKDVTPYEPITNPNAAGFGTNVAMYSTRVPKAKNLPISTDEQLLTTTFEDAQRAPEYLAKIADVIRQSNLITNNQAQQLSDADVLRAAMDVMQSNMSFIGNLVPNEERAITSEWYPVAYRLLTEFGKAAGLTPSQSVAVGAIFSPQRDWDQNLAFAQRYMRHGVPMIRGVNDPQFDQDLLRTYTQRELKRAQKAKIKAQTAHEDLTNWFNTMDFGRTPELRKQYEDYAERYLRTTRRKAARTDRELAQVIQNAQDWKNVPFSQLPLEGQAALLRGYVERAEPKFFDAYAPTGESMGPARKGDDKFEKIQAPPYEHLMKFIRIVQGGAEDPEVISAELGNANKVRSFYNNMGNLYDQRFTTNDTHMGAAAHLSPFGGQHPAIKRLLGASPQDSETGLQGTYPLYTSALQKTAQEFKQPAAGTQSIVWDAVRRLMSPEQKRDPKFIASINRLWNEYQRGDATLAQTQQRILTEAMATANKGQGRTTPLSPAPWMKKKQ